MRMHLLAFALLLTGCSEVVLENCQNGIDDDSDTLIDCNDSNCRNETVCGPENCSNGRDDNGNGAADCQDLSCAQNPLCLPESACGDSFDNDQDGTTDCDDADCADAEECFESECSDGVDNDNDLQFDCSDPDCNDSAVCIPEPDCTNGIDDDLDGEIDCADSDCSAANNCAPPGVGSPCTADPQCDGAVCLEEEVDGFPAGYCSQNCDLTTGVCSATGDALCIDVGLGTGQGLCLDACNVAGANCRPGYTCADVSNGAGQGVCFPDCQSDDQCPLTGHCNIDNGFCTGLEVCTNGIDDDDDGRIDCSDLDCSQNPSCAGFENCFDGIDNDGDGLADCLDETCAVACANGCVDPLLVGNNSTQNASNIGHSNISDGSCQTNPPAGSPGGGGGDVVFRVQPGVAQGVLNLHLSSAADLGVFVQTVCGNTATEIGCADNFIAGGQEDLQVAIAGQQAFFVFVGGFTANDQSPFTLEISISAGGAPELCADGIDNDFDGLADCQDTNCTVACANGCADPDPLTGTTAGNNTGHANFIDGFCQLVAGGGGGPDVVYRAVALNPGVLTLSLLSDVDLGLLVYDNPCGDPNVEVACVDDFFGPAAIEEVQLNITTPNEEFFVIISGFTATEQGPFTLFVN